MENFFNSIGKKVRDTAVAGAITVAAISSGDKAFAQNHEIDSVDLKIKNELYLVPKINVQEVYNKEKEENDQNFNYWGSLDSLPDTESVTFATTSGPDSVEITVKHKDAEGGLISKEVFNSIEELSKKYNEYSIKVSETLNKDYQKHIQQSVWNDILSQKEDSLPVDIENYTPTQKEIDILKQEAEKRNNGERTDGYDQIYHYYVDKLKTPEDMYAFYLAYNCKPQDLASYMVKKYYHPMLKK